MAVLFWIFIIYIVLAVIITACCLMDGEDLPDALAVGILWFFWLARATLRSIVRMIKEG